MWGPEKMAVTIPSTPEEAWPASCFSAKAHCALAAAQVFVTSTLAGDLEEPLVESAICNFFGLVMRSPS